MQIIRRARIIRKFSTSSSRFNENDILRNVLGHVLSTKTHDSGIVPLFTTKRDTINLNLNISKNKDAYVMKSLKNFEPIQKEFIEQRNAAKKLVSDIENHIFNLKTNTQITQYYCDTILPAYNNSSLLETAISSVDSPIVNSTTAPLLLETCMRVLRTEFFDPMGAIFLFQQSKDHSLEFFGYACTAWAYNEMLKIRWNSYRSLPEVCSLVSEMTANAVKPSLETAELLDVIYSEASNSTSNVPIRRSDLINLESFKKRYISQYVYTL